MKIGILTFHRACNHGAVLQCMALCHILAELGHEVEIIDYRQSYIEDFYKPFCLRFHKNSGSNLRHYLRGILKRIIRRPLFHNFLRQHLTLSDASESGSEIPSGYDAYIIGSDQLWSRLCTGSIDPVYFGQFEREDDSLLIGYAISAPNELVREIDKEWLKTRVEQFSHISFREESNTRYINNLMRSNRACTLLDPTLLPEKDFYDRLAQCKTRPSVAVMIYKYRLKEGEMKRIVQLAKSIARDENCSVDDLSHMLIAPSRFLSVIKHAKYVITNSFHCTVFSLVFQKRFTCLTSGDGLDERYVMLLKSAGAEDALCPAYNPAVRPVLDYSKITQNMEKLKHGSLLFLRNLPI